MSNSKNQIASVWKVVEALLRCSSYTYQGVALDKKHSSLITDAYTLWYLCTEDLLQSGGFSRQGIDRRWLNTISRLDVYDLVRALKATDESLLRDHSSTTYESFKRSLMHEYPFIGDLLSPMKQAFALWFQCMDHSAFSDVHCWLSFPSRLNLSGLTALESKALDDYLAQEEIIQVDGFTTEESQLIASWYPRTLELEAFFAEHFQPRHGPGSTADAGIDMQDKYLKLGTDTKIDYLRGRIGCKADYPRAAVPFERTAKLQFVPKSMLTYRSISMEPATLMWYQQGILNAFLADLRVRRGHPLRNRFHPEDQESNRTAAWLGSIDGSIATIDLSSASDSVSWSLVKRWFHDSVLYPWMLCTRSNRVMLPNGEVIPVKKYAPMGSALCFPTECIVFAAIVECAIKEAKGDPKKSIYRVYGDDIVVESQYADAVMSRLSRNGFRVNYSKSFTSPQPDWLFRESCGGEYLDGVDVTPSRLSRWFSGLHVNAHHPGRILSLVELANDCFSRLPSVRRRCISALLELPADIGVLFDGTGEKGLFSPCPSNFHLRDTVWSERYQLLYYRHGDSRVVRKASYPQVEDIRYFEYLRQTDGRRRLIYPEDRVDVDLSPIRAGKWSATRSPVEGM